MTKNVLVTYYWILYLVWNNFLGKFLNRCGLSTESLLAIWLSQHKVLINYFVIKKCANVMLWTCLLSSVIMERDLLQWVTGPVSHAFKKEVAMNGGNRTLSVKLADDIIITSSSGERSVTYLGPVLRQDPSFGSIWVQPDELQGLD